MRLLLAGLIFLSSVAAAVLVHVPRAHALTPDAGSPPHVRLHDARDLGTVVPQPGLRRVLAG